MKIKIKYCKKCETIVKRNYHLTGELKDWIYPSSFIEGNDILLFCKCGMWKNEDYFKTIEFEVDNKEFMELVSGDDIMLIKKHIILSNL